MHVVLGKHVFVCIRKHVNAGIYVRVYVHMKHVQKHLLVRMHASLRMHVFGYVCVCVCVW